MLKKIEESVLKIRADSWRLDEDFPGQKEDYFRTKVVELGMSLLTALVSEAAEGSLEEIDYIDSQIASKLVNRMAMQAHAKLQRKQLMEKFHG